MISIKFCQRDSLYRNIKGLFFQDSYNLVRLLNHIIYWNVLSSVLLSFSVCMVSGVYLFLMCFSEYKSIIVEEKKLGVGWSFFHICCQELLIRFLLVRYRCWACAAVQHERVYIFVWNEHVEISEVIPFIWRGHNATHFEE